MKRLLVAEPFYIFAYIVFYIIDFKKSLSVERWQMIKNKSSVTNINDSGYVFSRPVIKFHFDFQLVEHKSILPSLILTLSIPYGISNHDSRYSNIFLF